MTPIDPAEAEQRIAVAIRAWRKQPATDAAGNDAAEEAEDIAAILAHAGLALIDRGALEQDRQHG